MKIRHVAAAASALLLAAGIATPASAAEYGHVISSTPVYSQVTIPQRECTQQQVLVRQPQTGAGALIGALVGGGVGSTIGGGAGRAAATGIGAIAGALIGDRAEANAMPTESTTVQNCQTVSRVENRIVGYDVVYDYHGQRYSTRMARDPGDRIALNVSVAPSAGDDTYTEEAPVVQPAPQPVFVAPQPPVIYGPPVYVAPPPVVSVGVGWGWGWHGYHHWH